MKKDRLVLAVRRYGLLEKILPKPNNSEEDVFDRENDELWFAIIKRIKRMVWENRKVESIDP